MAIEMTVLTSGTDTVDRTVYTTASITPSANKLIIAVFTGGKLTSHATVPTLVGNGLTWVKIQEARMTPFSQFVDVAIYRAMGASPSAGTLVATWSAQMLRCKWSIVEFSGILTTGTDGEDAVGNVNRSTLQAGVTSLSTTITMVDGTSGAYSCGVHDSNGGISTPGTGMTTIHELIGDANRLHAQWRDDNDTSPDESWTGAAEGAFIAFELVAAAAASKGVAGHLGFNF